VDMSQESGFTGLSDEQADEFATRIHDTIRSEVAVYASLAQDSQQESDFRSVNRLTVGLFSRTLWSDAQPSKADLNGLGDAARRRVHQGVPLEAIIHSYRVAVRVLWQCLLELRTWPDLGRLGLLALEFTDQVSTLVENAYLEERQRGIEAQRDTARLLLTRVVLGHAVDEVAASSEAARLGLDLSQPHSILVVSRKHDETRVTRASDFILADAQARLAKSIDGVFTTLLSSGLVAVVPPSREVAAAELLTSLVNPTMTGYRFSVGVGLPHSGLRGLAASYEDAQRALAIGAITAPRAIVHRYADVLLYDLFKEGEPIERFVSDTLGPLLTLTAPRRERALETLSALFDSGLNRKQAAARLGIHYNTLALRLSAIERLLGGNIQSGDFALRTQLAVRLLPMTNTSSDYAYTSFPDGSLERVPFRKRARRDDGLANSKRAAPHERVPWAE
jgi:sugar diacid utilization regulator